MSLPLQLVITDPRSGMVLFSFSVPQAAKLTLEPSTEHPGDITYYQIPVLVDGAWSWDAGRLDELRRKRHARSLFKLMEAFGPCSICDETPLFKVAP